jgi:hypothetical protein
MIYQPPIIDISSGVLFLEIRNDLRQDTTYVTVWNVTLRDKRINGVYSSAARNLTVVMLPTSCSGRGAVLEDGACV